MDPIADRIDVVGKPVRRRHHQAILRRQAHIVFQDAAEIRCELDGAGQAVLGAGDRRDADIRRQTEILGDAFDEVILYQDQCQRGRADGEVLALLREGLARARRATAVEEIRGEFLAIDTALARIQPGELCLILIDQVEEALAHIAGRLAEVSIERPAKAAAQGELPPQARAASA